MIQLKPPPAELPGTIDKWVKSSYKEYQLIYTFIKSHFTFDKKGVHQIDRISDFLEKTGIKGFLAVELRMSVGKERQAYLVPWDIVEKKYQEKDKKISVDEIKANGKLKRRSKTYG